MLGSPLFVLFTSPRAGNPLNAILRNLGAFILGLSLVWLQVPVQGRTELALRPAFAGQVDGLSRRIPSRASSALTGSQFDETVRALDGRQREQAERQEVLHGNVPTFLRQRVTGRLAAQSVQGLPATRYVMTDNRTSS